MSMQQYPHNPIEQRKQAVRTYTTRGTIEVAGGLIGGIALGLLAGSWTLFILGLVIAVAGGFVNYSRVNKIINHRDPQ
ncbi:hypothetical protein [Corynebacterium aquilae]|uniref:Uncharacterized protein n=1 Tax=Corynebacterium aquilae DSM 44791 TaxID=1431546 RepID=A0A1L7CGU2_9CORY|nr:hypothetical protein [Corynebacterium aquilae]APT85068.1 hypothetical protein CAQU_08290 [Corynebacterium aquilae DSM 44791]